MEREEERWRKRKKWTEKKREKKRGKERNKEEKKGRVRSKENMTYCSETAHLRGQHFLTLIFGINTLFYLHQCINIYSRSSLKLILPIRAQ